MTARACSRCGSDVAVYPARCPVYCADCRRAYNREYMRRQRGTYQRHCRTCGVPVPHVRAWCDDHRPEAIREIKRQSARRRRAAAKASNRQWEQTQLPLEPVLRLIADSGLSINALGAADAKMVHRAQQRGYVPAWWADEFVVGKMGCPEVFDVMAREAGT